jgi:hypothetical protein
VFRDCPKDSFGENGLYNAAVIPSAGWRIRVRDLK